MSAGPAPLQSVPHLTGEYYLTFLARLHALLRPKSYLEIGTRTGESLALAGCASVAVDPFLGISSDVIGTKPACHFFQISSDDFFRNHDPAAILGRPVDLAFLDGMHLFEYLLRDFANTERRCRPNSVIMLHDCVPVDVYVADRQDDPERRRALGSIPEWWTGDVWKLVPILRRWRPDLVIHAIDAAPTGLILVTNLDPGSDVLARSYFPIVQEFAGLHLLDYGIERYMRELRLIATGSIQHVHDIGPLAWL